MSDKKEAIYNYAKEIFSARGFKDTNVTDITKAAGIATGSFYNYYPSKDTLFMEILLEENVKLKKSILEAVDLNGEPVRVVEKMLALNYEGMKQNPILKEWYNREAFGRIEQKYREENGLKRVDFMYDAFIGVVKKWQAEGKMRKDIDPEMIMAIFGAIVNIDTHKDEIGIQFFPQIQNHITEFVMKGLADDNGHK